jgi:hypothetical protein
MTLRLPSVRITALLLLLWFTAVASSFARAADDLVTRPRPVLSATALETAPVVDGEVLGDEGWHGVAPATDFWQSSPDTGSPASERTEVRVAYTRDTLYLAVVCHDRSPKDLVISEGRRDSPLDDTDSFRVIFDTFRDRQNGFVFGTNPNGLEYDGQVVNEGQGGSGVMGGQQAGSGGGFNLNWDASWRVRARVGEFGWSAEFAIPFRTLRYAGGEAQTWGVNFQRTIRRRHETAYWAPLPRQFTIVRLSQAGTLEGLSIPTQRNLKVTPFSLGSVLHEGVTTGRTHGNGEVGVDAKYSVTPSLTLDATVNTDFAQVEVDEQQINLNRFNLFYPEKRPFFLENAGLFSVGSPSEVEVFFSRRIGIGPEGQVLPILAGGRLSGQVGGLNVGALNMQTDSADGVAASNFTVLRARKDLPNQSNLGAIVVNRDTSWGRAGETPWNRSFAVDGRVGLGRYGRISGYAAATVTPGLSGDAGAYAVNAERDSPAWRVSAAFTDVGSHFNPEVGFLARDGGFRKGEAAIMRRIRPTHTLGLLEARPHVSYVGYWYPDGTQQTGFLHVDNHLEWRSGYEVHTGINFTREGVVEAFEIYPGVVVPVGQNDHEEASLVLMTNRAARVSGQVRANLGGFFGGTRVDLQPGVKVRAGDTFNAEMSLGYNDVDLPGGRFKTLLSLTRASYTFSPRTFVQALVQYNDLDNAWSANLRFGWIQQANTGLFVVYNDRHPLDGYSYEPGDRHGTDRSLAIKFSRMFDLLN